MKEGKRCEEMEEMKIKLKKHFSLLGYRERGEKTEIDEALSESHSDGWFPKISESEEYSWTLPKG